LWPSSGPIPAGPCLSCAEDSRANAVLQVGTHQSGVEGQNHLLAIHLSHHGV